jgi:hypothetical protein
MPLHFGRELNCISRPFHLYLFTVNSTQRIGEFLELHQQIWLYNKHRRRWGMRTRRLSIQCTPYSFCESIRKPNLHGVLFLSRFLIFWMGYSIVDWMMIAQFSIYNRNCYIYILLHFFIECSDPMDNLRDDSAYCIPFFIIPCKLKRRHHLRTIFSPTCYQWPLWFPHRMTNKFSWVVVPCTVTVFIIIYFSFSDSLGERCRVLSSHRQMR